MKPKTKKSGKEAQNPPIASKKTTQVNQGEQNQPQKATDNQRKTYSEAVTSPVHSPKLVTDSEDETPKTDVVMTRAARKNQENSNKKDDENNQPGPSGTPADEIQGQCPASPEIGKKRKAPTRSHTTAKVPRNDVSSSETESYEDDDYQQNNVSTKRKNANHKDIDMTYKAYKKRNLPTGKIAKASDPPRFATRNRFDCLPAEDEEHQNAYLPENQEG